MNGLRGWVPPNLVRWLGRATGRSLRVRAGFPDWPAAQAAAVGYENSAILQRVMEATRAVVSGQAAYERDGVLFDHLQTPFQLVAPLLRHALRCSGHLSVIDFGGSLGSTFRQCRHFLPEGVSLQWSVVEQPHFVAAGNAEFESEALKFHTSLDEVERTPWPQLLLASSVLQYLPDVDGTLQSWSGSNITTLVLDRTPVWTGDGHIPCVQQVPRHIYHANYPCWIVSQKRMLAALGPAWQLISEFDCPEGQHPAKNGPAFEYKGFIFERRPV